jgi:glutathione S-transferase
MKLYNNNLSPFSARCRLMLYYKGIEVEMVDPFTTLDPEGFLALTPLGKVPTLEMDDGWVLPESETICEYLEQMYPEPSLLPDDARERARVRLLGRIGDLYLLQPLTVLFGNIDPSVRDHDKVVAAFKDLKKALGWLNHYLDGTGYAVGGKMSLADCALVPILFFVRRIPELFGKSVCLLDDHPNATGYWRCIFEEPAVARIYEEMDAALKGTR